MTTVFDIINELRGAKHLSVRGLGQEAGIPPTTFESMMARRPRSIDIERLGMIAGVFGLEWQDLFEYGRDVHGKDSKKPKVDTYIKEDEIPYILERAFAKAGLEGSGSVYLNMRPTMSEPDRFRDVLHALIERLNDEGVMEAMFKLSEIERNSAYRR